MLTKTQIQYLKQQAMDKKVIVTVGQKGLTESVINELTGSLEHHELMKVKVTGLERDEREAAAESIAKAVGAEVVQIVGNNVTIFRKRKENSNSKLPR